MIRIMPRLVSTYIFKEMMVPFVLCIAILSATVLLGKALKLVELVVSHGVGLKFVALFVLSLMPSFLVYTIPISFLVAVLFAFTRLSSDNEIIAMKAAGLNLAKLMRPVIFLALIAYSLSLVITLYLFPWGNHNIKKLLFEVVKTQTVAAIEQKTFNDRFKGVVLYVDTVIPELNSVGGVFIYDARNGSQGGRTNIIFAEKGTFVPSTKTLSVFLNLHNGTIHREQDDSYHLAQFDTYSLELNLNEMAARTPGARSNRELSVGELRERIKEVGSMGWDLAPFRVDLHKRFALPSAIFVFAMLGVPLGIQKVRSARFTGFSVAIGVVLVYYILFKGLEALGDNSMLNPVIAVWGANLVMGALGAYMLRKAAMDKPIKAVEKLEEIISNIGEWFRKKL